MPAHRFLERPQALVLILELFILLTLGDCLSTYLCLTTPSEKFQVWEGQPLSAWAFEVLGLVPSLIIFALAKILGAVYLYRVALRSKRSYVWITSCMGIAVLIAAYVNYHNFSIWGMIRS